MCGATNSSDIQNAANTLLNSISDIDTLRYLLGPDFIFTWTREHFYILLSSVFIQNKTSLLPEILNTEVARKIFYSYSIADQLKFVDWLLGQAGTPEDKENVLASVTQYPFSIYWLIT